MSAGRLRLAVLGVSLAVLGGALGWSVGGLAPFGTFSSAYGRLADRLIPAADHIPEIISGITYDMRSLDSLGETFILFTAVAGATLLLRERKGGQEESSGDESTGDTIRLLGLGMVPAVIAVALWDGTTAGLSPGNGFQIGVILAGAVLLVWAAGSQGSFRRATPQWLVDAAEGTGAGGLVAIGLAGLVATGLFLEQFVPVGPQATVYSGGIVLLFSWIVALEVAASNVLLAREFLAEYAPEMPGTEEG